MSECSENIRKFRMNSDLTQKELADKLGVSFQTVSKYENGINEPDLAILRSMCAIFHCTLSELVGDAEISPAQAEGESMDESQQQDTEKDEEEDTTATDSQPAVTIIQVGKCADCGKDLYSNDTTVHNMVRSAKGSTVKENVKVCGDCFVKSQQLTRQISSTNSTINKVQSNHGDRMGLFDMSSKTVFIICTVLGVIGLGGSLTYCIMNYDTIGLGWTIGIPLIVAYVLFADGFCYMVGGNAGDIFITIVTKSIQLPGIIFTLSPEGIFDMVVLKIFFFILKIMLGICLFVLGFGLASAYAALSFPYNLIHSLATRH